MEKDNVIKALECCTNKRSDGLFDIKCEECPFEVGKEDCKDLDEKALSLINELTEEVEDLKAIAEQYQKQFEDCAEDRAKLTEENERLASLCTSKDVIIGDMNAENERLRAENKIEYETPLGKQTMPNLLHLEGDVARLYTQIKNEIKADTVRKMQKLIAEHATNGYPRKVRLDVVDQIAKEMLEGNNDK